MSALLLLAAGTPSFVLAVEVPGLFSAEVQFDNEAENPREAAYRAALIAVLSRVSGSELASDDEAIDALFPVPAAYVTQFRPGDEPDSLWVSFDDEALERVLRASGHTIWGADRPLTLVWVAVDWGQGEREILAAGDDDRSPQEARSIDRDRLLRERILEMADQRGLPIAFPLLDTTDLQSVTFSDIWGGFDDRVIDASRRYGTNSVLIGRVRSESSQPSRWTYIIGDQLQSWLGSPEQVVTQVADVLAAEFGVGGDAPLRTVEVRVGGIQTISAYGSLEDILSDVSLIENFRVAGVSGDVVSYQVRVRGGADRLKRALLIAGLLEQSEPEEYTGFDAPLALEFFFSP